MLEKSITDSCVTLCKLPLSDGFVKQLVKNEVWNCIANVYIEVSANCILEYIEVSGTGGEGENIQLSLAFERDMDRNWHGIGPICVLWVRISGLPYYGGDTVP